MSAARTPEQRIAWALLAAIVATSGCADVPWQETLRQWAAHDHGCELDRVRLVGVPRDPGDDLPVEVCGVMHTYHDVLGTHRQWAEQYSPAPPGTSPPAPPVDAQDVMHPALVFPAPLGI